MFKAKRKSKYELDTSERDRKNKKKNTSNNSDNYFNNNKFDDSNNLQNDDNDGDYSDKDDDEGFIDNFDSTGINPSTTIMNAALKPKSVSSLMVSLPGATAKKNKINRKNVNSTRQGETPSNVVRNIRMYLDILFSSVLLEAKYILENCDTGDEMREQLISGNSTESNKSSISAVPGVVSAILAYNNIEFKTVALAKTTVDIFEPIWYTYNVRQSKLILYINEYMYDAFCIKNGDSHVLFTNGIVPIERYNPYETNKNVPSVNLAIVHCAILCDHVTQHILDELFASADDTTANCADLHEGFGKHGTTLHSMFHLESVRIPTPRTQTVQNNNINAMMMLNSENFAENSRVTLPSFLNTAY